MVRWRAPLEAVVFERSLIVTIIGMLIACGCSSTPASPTATPRDPGQPPPAGPATVTISSAGIDPRELTVSVGAQVTFINSDRPEIDVVGFLVSGQTRQTAVFEQAKTCRFHDHANLGVAAIKAAS